MLISMKLFVCGIAGFDDSSGIEHLLPARRKRMERYLQEEDRARCLVAGLMLRYALGEGYGERLAFGPNGKPYLNDGSLFFNLSHAGEYVAMALSAYEVGVDIERVLPYSASVAKKCFTAEERAWLKDRNEDRAFYSLWTGKESVMKATGLGFSMPPEHFHVLPVLDGPHSIGGKTWYLQWHSMEHHEICVAGAAEETMQIISIGRAELL